MKKLLSIISLFTLTVSSSTTVFSCSTLNEDKASQFISNQWVSSLNEAYGNNFYNNIILSESNGKESKSVYYNQFKNILASKFIKSEQDNFIKWFDSQTKLFIKVLWGIKDLKNAVTLNLKTSNDDPKLLEEFSDIYNKNGASDNFKVEIALSTNDNFNDGSTFYMKDVLIYGKFEESKDDGSRKFIDSFEFMNYENSLFKNKIEPNKTMSVSKYLAGKYPITNNENDNDAFSKLVIHNPDHSYSKNNFMWVAFANDLFNDIFNISKLKPNTYNKDLLSRYLNGYDTNKAKIITFSDWMIYQLNESKIKLSFNNPDVSVNNTEDWINNLSLSLVTPSDEENKSEIKFHIDKDF